MKRALLKARCSALCAAKGRAAGLAFRQHLIGVIDPPGVVSPVEREADTQCELQIVFRNMESAAAEHEIRTRVAELERLGWKAQAKTYGKKREHGLRPAEFPPEDAADVPMPA